MLQLYNRTVFFISKFYFMATTYKEILLTFFFQVRIDSFFQIIKNIRSIKKYKIECKKWLLDIHQTNLLVIWNDFNYYSHSWYQLSVLLYMLNLFKLLIHNVLFLHETNLFFYKTIYRYILNVERISFFCPLFRACSWFNRINGVSQIGIHI